MKKYFLLIVSLAIFSVGKAQNPDCACFIKGIVRDQHSGQPVIGATVLLEGTISGVFTDEKGRYEIRNLCPGRYKLEARIVGYNTYRQSIDLTAGHEENFNLEE